MAGRGRLPAGDLVDAVVPDDDGQVARRHRRDGGEAAERHQERAVAFERDHAAFRLRQRDPERDRAGQAHAAEHVEILRPVAGGVEIEIGIADAGHDRLVAQLAHQPPGQIGAVEHLRGAGYGHCGSLRVGTLLGGYFGPAGFPPVSSGERMKTTGLCVSMACLMERSTTNPMVASSVRVWCATASESSTGRMVRATSTCPILNSPMVPRSDTTMMAGI